MRRLCTIRRGITRADNRGIPRSVTRSSGEFPNASAAENGGISREHQDADEQPPTRIPRLFPQRRA